MKKLVDGALIDMTDDEIAAFEASRAPGPAPVPAAVSRFQAKAALAQAGLLDDVEAAIAQADATTKLAWSDAMQFERASPTIAALAAALSLASAQVDDLFRQASTIRA